MQGPTSQESDIDSQNTVEAISPPRSRANLSSTNDYEAPVVTPISHSYDTRNTKREAEYSPLYPCMIFCIFLLFAYSCGLHVLIFIY
jgi:hypothetical protein